MIIKHADDRSSDIETLRVLKETAPTRYHSDIQRQIDAIYSGIEGERSAAHFINREFGDSERMIILHDVRLDHNGDVAQFDHIVIHRFQGTAWVLETKNYGGRLSCDEHGDWTVWYHKKPQPVASPINQARRHSQFLLRWLKRRGIKGVHTVVPVVLISPTSSVNRKHLKPDVHVVKSDNFGEWWGQQFDAKGVGTVFGMMGRHLLNGMTRDDLILLGKRLAAEHQPTSYDWRAMLRLPVPAAPKTAVEPPAPPKQIAEPAPKTQTSSKIAPEPATPYRDIVDRALEAREIATDFGTITVTRLPDGRIAVRNEKNDELISRVKKACKAASGQWNPRFSNWIVSEDKLPDILRAVS